MESVYYLDEQVVLLTMQLLDPGQFHHTGRHVRRAVANDYRGEVYTFPNGAKLAYLGEYCWRIYGYAPDYSDARAAAAKFNAARGQVPLDIDRPHTRLVVSVWEGKVRPLRLNERP